MSPPNVLLVVLDSVRKDHLTPYGYERSTTPTLEAFAEGATRYDRAISAAPWTPPSHAAMFTGKYPSNNGVFGLTPNLSPDQPHVAELLRDAGYATMGFSNSYHTSPDRGFDRGFDYYHDTLSLPRFAGKMWEPSLDFAFHLYDYFVRDYDDSSFQFRRLKTRLRRCEEPFFGFINMNSAHSPYDPPSAFKSAVEAAFDRWDEVDVERARAASEDAYEYLLGDLTLSDAEWELLRRWYDGEISYLDSILGDLFAFLKNRGLYDDTMIVVTSDHGEQFGERGLVYHQFSLSEVLINVPLLVKWPGQETAETVDELVSLVDLAPSMLELATGEYPAEMDGRSLRSEEEPTAVFAEYAGPSESIRDRFVERGPEYAAYTVGRQAVRTRDRKLVRTVDGETTLYDVSGGDEREVSDDAVTADLLERLDGALGEVPARGDWGDLDPHVERHLEEMGYL